MRDPAMDFSPKSPTSTTPLGRGRLAQGTQEIPVLLLEHLSLYAGTLSGKSIQERLKVCDTVEKPSKALSETKDAISTSADASTGRGDYGRWMSVDLSMASKAPAISTTVSTGKVASTSRTSRPLISASRILRYLKVAEHRSIATANL